VEGLEILLPERVVDQELEAERHDDVEQRLDEDAEADENQDRLVAREERFDEAIDGRERAGGFLRGKDDEVLILLIVLQFRRLVLFLLRLGGRRVRLASHHPYGRSLFRKRLIRVGGVRSAQNFTIRQ